MMSTIANPTIVPIRVARTRRTTQIVASIRRLCASRYIQSPPSSRAMMPIAHRARTTKTQPATTDACSASSIRCLQAAAASGYFMVVRARRTASGLRQRHLPRRGVRVRPADRRVAHALLESAMLAFDPDADRQVGPVPRPLAALRTDLRVGGAHHEAPIGDLPLNLSEPLPRPSGEGGFGPHLLAPALRLDVDRVPDLALSQPLDEVRDPGERLGSEARDDVPDLEARAFGRRARRDLGGEDAVAARDPVVGREASIDVVPADAEPRPLDVSVLEDLAGRREGGVDRDREADAFRVGDRRGVDRDHAPAQVDEGPSAVPRVHRGIRP